MNGREDVWKRLNDDRARLDDEEKKNRASGGWFRGRGNKANSATNFDTDIWLRECTQEVLEPIQGQTSGEIPKWVKGALIRNGPGKWTFGVSSFRHVFDCSSLLHRFEIKGGAATYQCRFLDSSTYKKNTAANRIVITEFGTHALPDPCHTIFQRFSSYFHSGEHSDNANVSIYPMSDEYYAFAEYPYIHKIDPVTLETLRRVNVQKKTSIVHHTSHPHVINDGTMFNVGLSVAKKPAYTVVEFPKSKKCTFFERSLSFFEGDAVVDNEDVFSDARVVASVPSRWGFHPGYMHSFGLTDNYFLLIEQPLCLSVPTLWSMKVTHHAPVNMLKWYDNYPTLIHVVHRESGKLVNTYTSETFFFFHTINQYEENGHIVFDVCVYRDAAIIQSLLVDALKGPKTAAFKKSFASRAARFVLPLEAKDDAGEGDNLVRLEGSRARAWKIPGSDKINVAPELLSDVNCEMPRVKYPELCGRKYRYFYGIILDMAGEHPGGLVKVDTETKKEKIWYEKGVIASEPVFIPDPDSEIEDEGVVVSSLLFTGGDGDESAAASRVALLVLNASTFEELGRTVFDTPGPIPSTFHGWFCESSQ